MGFTGFSIKAYRLTLVTSTALIAAVTLASAARADTTITSPTAATVTITTGNALTVTNTGSITANPAVKITGATTIDNAGHIKSTSNSSGTGINVTGTVTGTLTNEAGASITGGSHGIYVHNGGDIAGGIDNSGRIHSNGGGTFGAIDIEGTGNVSGGITNNVGGTIDNTSDAGINVFSGADMTGQIANHGLISGYTGIFVGYGGADVSGGIDNTGTIKGNGAGGIWIHGDADVSGGIVNSGTITDSAHGIYIDSSAGLAGGIDNSGFIKGYGGIDFKSGTRLSGGITNEATGTISSPSNAAINIYSGAQMTGDITNRGLIQGASTGIFAGYGGADIQGQIINSGTIIGNVHGGIWVQGAGDISGGVDNKSGGTIYGAPTGIRVTTGGDISGLVKNEAGGLISGSSIGVYIDNANMTGGIDNAGKIVGVHLVSGTLGGLTNETGGTLTGGSYGLYVSNGVVSGAVSNSGLVYGGNTAINLLGGADLSSGITNNAGGTISGVNNGLSVTASVLTGQVNNGGTIVGQNGILVSGGAADLQGGIVNSGLISAVGGGSMGIHVASGADISGGVTNTATGTITANGFDGIDVIGSGGDISGGVANSGDIIGNYDGIYLGSGGDISGGITNNAGGTISGGQFGVHMQYGNDISGGVDNSGLIQGGIAAIGVENNNAISGGITNEATGTIIGGTAAAINLQGLTTTTPITINGGSIIGDVKDDTPTNGYSPVTIGGDFTTGGNFDVSSVTVNNGKTLEISSGNTFTVDQMNTSTGGTLAFMVTTDGAGGTGELVVSGAAQSIDLSGMTITVDVAASPTLADGDVLEIAQGNAAITGGPGGTPLTVVDNSASWDFQIVDGTYGTIGGDATDLYLLVSAVGGCSDVTINSASAATQNMCGGETLTVTGGGTLSAAPAVVVAGVSANMIDNSGIINGGGTKPAISINTGGDLTGGIVNSGTITGDTGVRVDGSSDISGGISNSGHINGQTNGILVTGNASLSGGIDNANSGTISSTGSAITVNGGTAGQITNDGLISGGSRGIVSYNTSDISGGITNNAGGTISSGGIGIFVFINSDVSGGITNAGNIYATSTALAIVSGSDVSGGIANSGTIAGANTGVFVYNSQISGGLTNAAGGTIDGGTGKAINMLNLSGATPITINGGSIIGDVTDNAPANGYSPVTIGGNFTTSGNFDVSSLTVNSGKTLEISSGNTFTVDHMNASSGSTLAFMVTTDVAGGTGELVVSGAAQSIDLSGVTVKVDVAASPTLTDGDVLEIAQGNAAITGGPGGTPLTVVDNSASWDFQIVDGTYGTIGGDATDLYLLVSAVASGGGLQADTPGNAHAATSLQGLSGTTDPQLQQIVTNVNNATTQAQYNSLLSSVQPDVSGATRQASLDVLDKSLDLVSQWLDGVSDKWTSTGLSAGNATGNDLQGWAQAFGGYAVQGTRDNVAGYHASTGGFALGVDTGNHYEKGKVGIAVSYAHTAANARSANATDSDIDSYQVTAYGELKLSQASFVRGMAAYVHGSTDTVRHDVGGVPGLDAHGSFDSSQYTARVIAGRGVMMAHDLTLTPSVMADWTHYVPQDYTETGAGGADLQVTQKALDMAELGAGLDATWHFQQESGAVFLPGLRAGYRYDLVGDRLDTTAAFTGGGAAFTSPGPVPARGRFNLGGSLSWQAPEGWDAILGYDFDYRENYLSHSGFFRVMSPF